jgi:hypothetical protein
LGGRIADGGEASTANVMDALNADVEEEPVAEEET